jgi:hypothetical protein
LTPSLCYFRAINQVCIYDLIILRPSLAIFATHLN